MPNDAQAMTIDSKHAWRPHTAIVASGQQDSYLQQKKVQQIYIL